MNLAGKAPTCPRCGHEERRKLAKGPHPLSPGGHEPRAG